MQETPKPPFFGTFAGKISVVLTVAVGIFLITGWFLLPTTSVWTNDASIQAYDVQISADIPRRIIKFHVDEGDFVKKGDLLVELDRQVLETRLVEATTGVAVLKASLNKATTYMQKVRDDFFVAKEEFANNIISFLQFDHVEKEYILALHSLELAEKSLENGVARRDVVLAELQHTKILAPRDGYIAKRWATPGDVAMVGAPLFSLHALDFLWITANLEETKLRHIRAGSSVSISVDSYPSKTLQGKVWVIQPSAAAKFALIPPSNATGNFTKVVQRIPIKIALENQEECFHLFPGMSCSVTIQVR